MTKLKLISAVSAATLAVVMSSGAYAQAFNGASGAAPVTTTTTGASTTSTTGDSSVAPFTNVTTTVQAQTVASTTAATTTPITPIVFNGQTYTGSKTVSGTGSQAQTVTSTLTNTFNPGPPPTLASSVTVTNPAVNVGAATVTAVSATGSFGNVIETLGGTLATSGPVSAGGTVTATANSDYLSTSGNAGNGFTPTLVLTQSVGTATYNPTTGLVTVTLPSTPTNQTTLTSSGLTTTGTVAATTVTATTVTGGTVNGTVINANVGGSAGAAALNLNGGRIVNVAAGTSATDAVNLGQLNSAVSTVNTSITNLGATVAANYTTLSLRADAGTAVAAAMSGGTFLPGKKFNLTANVGGYRGQTAIAGQIGFLVTDNVALNAGVSTSVSGSGQGGTAWRGGISLGF